MIASKLSFAGSWQYSNGQDHDIVSFYSPIFLGDEKKLGFVLGGWAYSGWTNKTFNQTKIAILDQRSDGSFQVSTEKYAADATINGTGSINVYDFNGDGRQDILLIAHNESPLVDKNSSAFIATPSGTFQKNELEDSVQAHFAQLSDWEGNKVVVTAGYGDYDPYYKYDPLSRQIKAFRWPSETWNGQTIKKFYASTATIADLDNDGDAEIVIGDVLAAPGISYDNTLSTPRYLAVYQLQGNDLASYPSFKSKFYFDNNSQYKIYNPENVHRLSHNSRLWIEDINHDGLKDIIAGSSLWIQNVGHQRSKFEIFQNTGNLHFQDVTSQLTSAYLELSDVVDYSMQMIDIDSSGIKTFFLGEGYATSTQNNPNYILLNDGTGKLYRALHDEFILLGEQVKQFLNDNNLEFNKHFIAPKFIAYKNSNGCIDFIAQWIGDAKGSIPLVNVLVGYNPAVDFTTDIVVNDRNQSTLIRTWAGDDSFYDTNVNSFSTINGGLGIDQSFYSAPRKNYSFKLLDTGIIEITHQSGISGKQFTDKLIDVERLHFSDTSIGFDSISGKAYRIYKAAFDRTPDTGGLGYWIKQMDQGMDMVEVAARFIDSAEFRILYGQNPSNADFLSKVYNNVLDRNPDADGLAWWVNEMKTNPAKTWQKVLADFAESTENQANVASVIATGITFDYYNF